MFRCDFCLISSCVSSRYSNIRCRCSSSSSSSFFGSCIALFSSAAHRWLTSLSLRLITSLPDFRITHGEGFFCGSSGCGCFDCRLSCSWGKEISLSFDIIDDWLICRLRSRFSYFISWWLLFF